MAGGWGWNGRRVRAPSPWPPPGGRGDLGQGVVEGVGLAPAPVYQGPTGIVAWPAGGLTDLVLLGASH